MIFTRRGFDIDQYPVIKDYLSQFQERWEPKPKDFMGNKWKGRKPGRYKWYEIQDAVDYYGEFEKSKIVYPNICKRPEFTIDDSSQFTNQKCFIIPIGNKYLCAILNSNLTFFVFTNILPKLRGDFYEPSYLYFKNFPVFDLKETKYVEEIVTKILSLKKQNPSADTSALEAEIDQMVYELYGLGEEEIAIAEGS